MFRHPKYYKELRKLRNKETQQELQRVKPGSSVSQSDQAISDHASTEVPSVRPGPGPKLQATSNKPQAASSEKNRPQASSPKQQASSSKPQASSSKI